MTRREKGGSTACGNNEQTELPRSGSLFFARFWAVLALLLGSAATLLVHHQEQQYNVMQWRLEQETLASKAVEALQTQLHSAAFLLRTVQSLYLASEEVTPEEFSAVYNNMRPQELFPSLQALAYAEREVQGGSVHFITRLAEPSNSNTAIIGLDVSDQSNNLLALQEAWSNDQPTLSAPFRLKQFDGTATPEDGVVMRLPVFSNGRFPLSQAEREARLEGSIAVSFRIASLIRAAFSEEVLNALRIRIDDVTGGDSPSLPLFDSDAEANTEASRYVFQQRLNYGGRVWRIQMFSLRSGETNPGSYATLIAGFIASILMALLVLTLARTRYRALTMASKMSQRYRESELRFRTLNDLLPAMVLLVDGERKQIVYANLASEAKLGTRLETASLFSLLVDPQAEESLKRLIEGRESASEVQLRDAKGHAFWANVALSAVVLDEREQWLVVATDINEQRRLNELLGHQASHDALTDLFNRREFERRIQNTLESPRSETNMSLVLYLDLDQFKVINDTSGHLAGDQLLIQVSRLLQRQLKTSDVLARLGGDEFGILAEGLRSMADARALAERLRRCLDDFSFSWKGVRHLVSGSVGAVLITQPDLTLSDVLAQADSACYMAKEAGRNRVVFYSAQDSELVQRRMEMDWANLLRLAINEQRFVLMYQEIQGISPHGNDCVTVELLLRYRGDDGELVSPGHFIPAAERYGLMPMIDRWVVETALANFDRLHPVGRDLVKVSINLSGGSIEDDGLAESIIELLHQHHIEPSRVCFEITETVAINKYAKAVQVIEKLRAEGCWVALDDFGAGMSSFGYLKSFPLDAIKIDGSFVRDMLSDPVSHAMVRAVTEIGRHLGLQVVAEWVPDEAALHELAAIGVHRAQGFILHKPEMALFQRT